MKQRGFTLIELIVVIVILGILAAVALPKFIDLKSDASEAAAAGVAGAVASASALNYSARLANSAKPGTYPIAGCSDSNLVNLLVGNALPTGYTIAATSGAGTCTAGNTTNCTITAPSGGSAVAALTCSN